MFFLDDLTDPAARKALKCVWESRLFWGLTATAGFWAFSTTAQAGLSEAFVAWAFTTLLIAIAVADQKTMIVPDALLYPLAVLAVFYAPFSGFHMVLGAGLLGGGFFVLKIALEKRMGQEALGWGDIKLMAVLGLWVGHQGVSVLLLVASFSALLVVYGQWFLGKNTQHFVPFAPYLAFGGWVAFGYAPFLNAHIAAWRMAFFSFF